MEAGPRTLGVVIRTLNESELIGRCLETLRNQRTQLSLDILVVDSGSTDATMEIARAHGARIVEIPPADFDYSKALNLGIEEVRGELVVLLSAHSIPLDEQWVERMTAPFSDPTVAGVAGGQIPWPDAPWWEVARISRAFATAGAAYRGADAEDIVFSNAASCIRRKVWAEHQFTLPMSEDLEWAGRVVDAGWTIVYEPAAKVYHSHDESPRAQARRMIDYNRVGARAGSERSLARTVREAGGLLYRNTRTVLALGEPLGRRSRYLKDLVLMAWYYVIDFSAEGSIAERRREATVPAPAHRS